MTNTDLRERAERLAQLEETAAEAKADVKAAYEAAKSAGYTVTALRKAIKIHGLTAEKRTKHDSEQMDLEMYLAEIEGTRLAEAAE